MGSARSRAPPGLPSAAKTSDRGTPVASAPTARRRSTGNPYQATSASAEVNSSSGPQPPGGSICWMVSLCNGREISWTAPRRTFFRSRKASAMTMTGALVSINPRSKLSACERVGSSSSSCRAILPQSLGIRRRSGHLAFFSSSLATRRAARKISSSDPRGSVPNPTAASACKIATVGASVSWRGRRSRAGAPGKRSRSAASRARRPVPTAPETNTPTSLRTLSSISSRGRLSGAGSAMRRFNVVAALRDGQASRPCATLPR